MYEAPCPYVPLSKYDWKLHPASRPPGCPIIQWNSVVYSLLAAFESCTICIAFYLHIQLFYLFKGKKTLYFWSILASTWGTIINLLGLILQQSKGRFFLTSLMLNIGWVLMVTGFSFVLYSRLHLLNPSKRLLKIILIGIIVDAFLFHGPIFVITTMASVHLTPIVYKVYKIVAYTEIGLSVQEAALSTLYIYLFVRFTKDSIKEPATRKTLTLLLIAECIVISTDVVLCALLYLRYYLPRQMIYTWVFVVKLQIEFVILNSLQKFSRRRCNRLELGGWQDSDDTVLPSSGIISPVDAKAQDPFDIKVWRGESG